MKQLIKGWFDMSLQGVAFAEPIPNGQGEVIDFRYQLVNAAFAGMLRCTKEELIGQAVRKVFQPGQENDFFLPMATVIQTGDSQQLLKHYLLDGEDVWHDVTLTRIDGLVMINVQDVSEQKKAERELKRRLAMESIVSSVSSRLFTLKAADVDTYIEEALEQISTHINAERGSIFFYSDDNQRGSCVYEWCAPGILTLKDKIKNTPITSFKWAHKQLREGKVIRLEVDSLPPYAIPEKALFESMSIYSVINLPLIQDNKTYGFIAFYTIGHPQLWDQNDVLLLETFSTLIANVLYRLQQEEALRRANQRLEGLHAIDQALLNYRLADQSPLSIAMQYMYCMVPCNRITVSQINGVTGQIVAMCQILEGKLEMNPGLVMTAPALYERFLRNHEANRPIYYPNLEADSIGIPPELTSYLKGFRSQVIIPLYSRKDCIGAFTLASDIPYFFTEEYLQIAQELTGPLAIVLHQQQLDDQLKQYTEHLEHRVEERAQEIRQLSTLHQAILRHAGQAIISTDMNGVVQTANQASEHLLGYRVDELIGQTAHLELGPSENPILFIDYRPNGQPPPVNIFADALACQGYFHAECIAMTKTGEKIPILLAASALQDSNGIIIGYVGISTNISALKIAERKLQRKNQELNTFFDVALDLHCILNVEGRFLKANRAWETTLGYSTEELGLLTCWELQHPHEQVATRQLFQSLIDNEPIYNQISQLRKKDGTYRIIEWSAIGIDKHIYASAKDITERQQAENQMIALNQRLQLATQAAGQGIWENDLDKETLFWDDRLWELHGLEPRQHNWNFQEFTKLIHPDDLPTLGKRFNQDLSGHKISDVIRVIRQNDGAIRYFETNGLVIHNDQGKAVRVIGVVWDVTDRKLAEVALRESEQRFREIAENVDEVFWIHSAEPFRLLYINPAFERVWNTRFDSLLENPFSFIDTILTEDQPAVWNLIEHYKAGQEGQLYFRLRNSEGSLRWLYVRSFIIRDEWGKVVRHIGLVSDVTSQKEKEFVLQQSLLREQELNQLKSQFVATASHEFRTPLTTIQSSVDLIRLYLDVPAGRVSIQKHLGVIEKQIDQFSTLLTDVLTIGKIESGKVTFSPQWINVVSLCEEIITTHFNQQNAVRQVRMLIEGTPYKVYLDDKLISHVIVNLLSNAFKFSMDAPCLRILFTAKVLVLQIIDEGIGIPEKELSTLFQAFFRASNTAGIPGTGLGLVIARQFVELHGGQLAIQSEEKKGTICTVSLPTRPNELR